MLLSPTQNNQNGAPQNVPIDRRQPAKSGVSVRVTDDQDLVNRSNGNGSHSSKPRPNGKQSSGPSGSNGAGPVLRPSGSNGNTVSQPVKQHNQVNGPSDGSSSVPNSSRNRPSKASENRAGPEPCLPGAPPPPPPPPPPSRARQEQTNPNVPNGTSKQQRNGRAANGPAAGDSTGADAAPAPRARGQRGSGKRGGSSAAANGSADSAVGAVVAVVAPREQQSGRKAVDGAPNSNKQEGPAAGPGARGQDRAQRAGAGQQQRTTGSAPDSAPAGANGGPARQRSRRDDRPAGRAREQVPQQQREGKDVYEQGTTDLAAEKRRQQQGGGRVPRRADRPTGTAEDQAPPGLQRTPDANRPSDPSADATGRGRRTDVRGGVERGNPIKHQMPADAVAPDLQGEASADLQKGGDGQEAGKRRRGKRGGGRNTDRRKPTAGEREVEDRQATDAPLPAAGDSEMVLEQHAPLEAQQAGQDNSLPMANGNAAASEANNWESVHGFQAPNMLGIAPFGAPAMSGFGHYQQQYQEQQLAAAPPPQPPLPPPLMPLGYGYGMPFGGHMMPPYGMPLFGGQPGYNVPMGDAQAHQAGQPHTLPNQPFAGGIGLDANNGAAAAAYNLHHMMLNGFGHGMEPQQQVQHSRLMQLMVQPQQVVGSQPQEQLLPQQELQQYQQQQQVVFAPVPPPQTAASAVQALEQPTRVQPVSQVTAERPLDVPAPPPPPRAEEPVDAAPAMVVQPASGEVRNEWAERLAQQAAAKLSVMKSSLIGSADSQPPRTASGSLRQHSQADESSRAPPPLRSAAPLPPPPPAAPPSGPTAYNSNGYSSGSYSRSQYAPAPPSPQSDWREPAAAPAPPPPPRDPVVRDRDSEAAPPQTDAVERPKLKLQPRSLPLPSGEPPAPADGRPRLKLQPRTKAAGEEPAVAAATAVAGAATSEQAPVKSASIFGAARPREEVLKGRGTSDAVPAQRVTTAVPAVGRGPASVAASVTSGVSGEDDQWQVVDKRGRAKVAEPAPGDSGNALLREVDDPFFGRGGHGVAVVGRAAPGRAFGSGSYGKGSYSNDNYMNNYGRGRGYSTKEEDDDGDVFKRHLPTRAGLF